MVDAVSIPIWVITGLAFGAVLWGVWIKWTIQQVLSNVAELLKMHKDPDEYGFGSGAITDLDDTINELIHYMKWDIRQRTGKEPPPPSPLDRTLNGRR